jgi:hypothetical protein
MNKKIYTLILGNNDKLFGAINDAKMIYNIFYKFYLKENIVWNKPDILLNDDITIHNIINFIKNNIYDTLILYFSGHSDIYGNIKFYNEYVSNNLLLNIINYNISTKQNNYLDLYIIIDSCYSEKFYKTMKNITTNHKNINYIKNIYYIVSSQENQKSKEILIENDIEKNDLIPIGIFTYIFCNYLKQIKHIDDIENIILKKNIWNIIDIKYGQKICFYKISSII